MAITVDTFKTLGQRLVVQKLLIGYFSPVLTHQKSPLLVTVPVVEGELLTV
jgi:hypothetical protein